MAKEVAPYLELANRVHDLFGSVSGVLNSWILYLIDHEFDRQPELRNRIFVIFISGLADAALNFDTRVNTLRVDARKLNHDRALYYINILEQYLHGCCHALSCFSKDEMIYMSELRNQWVHGLSSRRFKERQDVRYVVDRKMIKEKIDHKLFWEAFRRVQKSKNVDEVIEDIRERYYKEKLLFWGVSALLSKPDIIEAISNDIFRPAQYPAVQFSFHSDGYYATQAMGSAWAIDLLTYRALATKPGRKSSDRATRESLYPRLRRRFRVWWETAFQRQTPAEPLS